MAHVDFTAELTIEDRWFMDADVRARRSENDKEEIKFYALTLPPGVEYRAHRLQETEVYEYHQNEMARVLYAAAVATWKCNPNLEQELEENEYSEHLARREIAEEAEYERRTGYHDVAA